MFYAQPVAMYQGQLLLHNSDTQELLTSFPVRYMNPVFMPAASNLLNSAIVVCETRCLGRPGLGMLWIRLDVTSSRHRRLRDYKRNVSSKIDHRSRATQQVRIVQ